ncbi:OLC1v1034097C2 [Oldenlandia corymbosa var. corymbosa]|nr:OLC1v1034097C2 [Oldenlandia corymbosa var. corymbosa]
MKPSHVSRGFWLLPLRFSSNLFVTHIIRGWKKKFCVKYLPKNDAHVFLVDEEGEKHRTKYLWPKNGLSGGWRGFAVDHELLEDDVSVFQLIEPCKLQVYIIRRGIGSAEIDKAIVVPNSELQAKSTVSTETAIIKEEPENVENAKMEDYMRPPHVTIPRQDYYISAKGNDGGSFKNFNIVANGVVIDSEIPTHLRAKYYELCSSQNAYLHSSLLEDVNCKLVAGAIIEIVNISDAIRAAKVTADLDCRLQAWDKVAKSFEDWGMTVRFLRKRIKKLLSFHSEEQQEMILSKKSERARLETDMRDLETKLVNVKGVA